MAIKGERLPPPPPDLLLRRLPLKRIEGAAYRIHLGDHNPLYFGRSGMGRFDDPLGQYGVLYAGLTPEGAFAEVFLRNLALMLIAEADVRKRSISAIEMHDLKCVDLSGPGVRTLSCDNRISTEKPYDTARLWSRALHDHPAKADGIIYRSRHNPQLKCLALYDRCRGRLSPEGSEPLMEGKWLAWTIRQISRYRLSLEPDL